MSSGRLTTVSVLFSEPKIPQFPAPRDRVCYYIGFSALQRAENSSIVVDLTEIESVSKFQCSSASRKFLNRSDGVLTVTIAT